MHDLNETHDPTARSWVASANDGATAFPLQNLPFACFGRDGEAPRGGVAIGEQIVDLARLSTSGALQGVAAQAAAAGAGSTLNPLMAAGPAAWSALRLALFRGLRSDADRRDLEDCLVPQAEARYALPAHIGDYTDFYTSIHHATAVGRLFRPDNPLLPNYHWVPIGYHGRSSSIAISGQRFPRPAGQRLAPGEKVPVVGPSQRLDYELELGLFIGPGNPRGTSIPVGEAEQHIFGLCLLNDWSARDLQAWEYQPLGPFLAKNFATTISPWVVTLEAMRPFRAPFRRDPAAPAPLPYLQAVGAATHGALDVRLEAYLQSARMRERLVSPQRLSSTSFRHSYWTIAQLVAHHTVNGCDLRPGDLLGTGTQSGPTPGEAGSLVELTAGGSKSLSLDGESRTFLEDGDRVVFRAWCEAPGAVSIGFGEVSGEILPAVPADPRG